MTQNCNCHGAGGQNSQTVAATLERPRYSPGLILEDSDLTAAVDYTRSLSRLLFRNLFGCGVICGLTVKVDEECGLNVTVSPGLALDGCGDPQQLPSPVTIAFDKRKAEQIRKDAKPFWVILCGKEKLCQPRSLVCEADDYDGATQATRIRALSEVTVSFEAPDCICGCPNPGDSAPSDMAAAPSAGRADAAVSPSPSGRNTCNDDHDTRTDCAEDCGCGSACGCGCCVLLARISLVNGVWRPLHKGVRRLVRPAMVGDREPGAPVAAAAVAAPQAIVVPPPPPTPDPVPVDPKAPPPANPA
ncbi:MAG: hypothetical protein JO276_08945 [Sphingomonadaceae bacterium]|nr:hypothetical protein [Sphingomonadaceae bacterium]